jgi:GLPGLI family protein
LTVIYKYPGVNSTSYGVLTIRDSISYYDIYSAKENYKTPPVAGSRFRHNGVYKNFSSKEMLLLSQPVDEQKYIVADKVDQQNWSITEEEKVILGYRCHKAIMQDAFGTVEAWFTRSIASPAGPDVRHGLPGLILQCRYTTSLPATAISITKGTKDIMKPRDGRKVTRQQFIREVEIWQKKNLPSAR